MERWRGFSLQGRLHRTHTFQEERTPPGEESGSRGGGGGLQSLREILQVGLKGPARPGIGVLGGCQTFTWGGLTHRFEKPGNREAFNLDPTNGAKEALGVPPQIHSYFENKRQACGHSQRRSHSSQGWKADLQRPKIRQKARAQ